MLLAMTQPEASVRLMRWREWRRRVVCDVMMAAFDDDDVWSRRRVFGATAGWFVVAGSNVDINERTLFLVGPEHRRESSDLAKRQLLFKMYADDVVVLMDV